MADRQMATNDEPAAWTEVEAASITSDGVRSTFTRHPLDSKRRWHSPVEGWLRWDELIDPVVTGDWAKDDASPLAEVAHRAFHDAMCPLQDPHDNRACSVFGGPIMYGVDAAIAAVKPQIADVAREDEKYKADLAISFWALENDTLRAKVAHAEEVTARLVSVIARQEKALSEWEAMKHWFDTWSIAAERDGSYRMDAPLYRDALRMVDELVRQVEAERNATRLELEAVIAKAAGLTRIVDRDE